MTEAEEYLLDLAEASRGGAYDDYVFEDVEVSDPIAGQMAADPRVDIVEVKKGEFGLDFGTMILSFRIRDALSIVDLVECPVCEDEVKELVDSVCRACDFAAEASEIELIQRKAQVSKYRLEASHGLHDG